MTTATVQRASKSTLVREAAALFSLSERSVWTAVKVMERGIPELMALIRDGSLKLNQAERVAELPVAEQRALLAEGVDAIKAAAKSTRAAPSPLQRCVKAWLALDADGREEFAAWLGGAP